MARPSQKKKDAKSRERSPETAAIKARPQPAAVGAASRKGIDQRRWIIAAVLFAAVLGVFWPCINNEFINCDDEIYVTVNSHVQQGFTVQSIKWAFTNFDATNWHPLTWLSNILAWDLFGPKPAGHHFFNIFLHALNAALLYVVFEMMTGLRWRSLALAAIFAFHPLRVESVAWVAERKDVLSTTFWFLAIWAHVRYSRALETKKSAGRFYLCALGLFVLALLTKPMVVTLPFTLLLLDYWPLKRTLTWTKVWLEKLPHFALTAASCAITYIAQKSGGAVSVRVPIYMRVETALLGYGRYLGKMFWPRVLAMPYPYPHRWPIGAVVFAAIGIVVISTAAVIYRKRLPWLPVGWFWYLGTLVPVIGLIQVGMQSIADRYTYIPEIGIAIILVWGSVALWERLSLPAYTLATIGAVSLSVCAFLTVRQIGLWQNSLTLFTHAIEVTDDNYLAYQYVGDYYYKRGDLKNALEDFMKCLDGDPKNEEALSATAYILFFNAGQRDAGIRQMEKAVALKPDSVTFRVNLGMFYKEAGRYAEAETQLHEALKLDPDNAESDVGLAYMCLKEGRRDEAITHLKHALQVKPDLQVAQKLLDAALASSPK